jgi:hypothetical protein
MNIGADTMTLIRDADPWPTIPGREVAERR